MPLPIEGPDHLVSDLSRSQDATLAQTGEGLPYAEPSWTNGQTMAVLHPVDIDPSASEPWMVRRLWREGPGVPRETLGVWLSDTPPATLALR